GPRIFVLGSRIQRGIVTPCLRMSFCNIWRETFERAAARAMLPFERERTVSRYFSSNAVVALRRAARSGSISLSSIEMRERADAEPSADEGGTQPRDAGGWGDAGDSNSFAVNGS